DGTAIAARMMTGMMVQRISIGVLWVVRDGVGLARALKRTMTIASRIRTKSAIAVVIQNRNVLKVEIWSMTGDADSWRSICQGVGCPSPANAAPALASKVPKISAVARNPDNTGIALGSDLPRSRLPRSRPVFGGAGTAQPHHICVSNTCLSCNGTFIVQRQRWMVLPAGFCSANMFSDRH